MPTKTGISTVRSGTLLEPNFCREFPRREGSNMRGRISTESLVLCVICLADMLSTLVLASMGSAVEYNPLMAACLRHSPCTFVLVKVASFLPFIVVIEWQRRRNPGFARTASRAAILLYLVTYAVLMARTNLV
jgi:hypothetical protein